MKYLMIEIFAQKKGKILVLFQNCLLGIIAQNYHYKDANTHNENKKAPRQKLDQLKRSGWILGEWNAHYCITFMDFFKCKKPAQGCMQQKSRYQLEVLEFLVQPNRMFFTKNSF